MKNKNGIYRMTKISVIAAVYVVATVLIAPLSYGVFQFRFSEILMLLCCFSPDYCVALSLGCLISNMFSPMAAIDIPVGTAATVIAAFSMLKCRNLPISALICSAVNGIIVGIELIIMYKEPPLLAILSVFIGEFAVVFILGVPVFSKIEKTNVFKKYIGERKLKIKA